MPDEGVAVVAAGHYFIGDGAPVDGTDFHGVLRELVGLDPFGHIGLLAVAIYDDLVVVVAHGAHGPVPVKRLARDGAAEPVPFGDELGHDGVSSGNSNGSGGKSITTATDRAEENVDTEVPPPPPRPRPSVPSSVRGV